jgi:hypothetical protein
MPPLSCVKDNQNRKIVLHIRMTSSFHGRPLDRVGRFYGALSGSCSGGAAGRFASVIPHTYSIAPSVHSGATEGSKMYLVYGLIILAMIFFLALPITDARTVRMKLSVVSSLGVLLAVSVVVPRLMH